MMSELDRSSHLLPNVKKFVILLAILWTVLICGLALWHTTHVYDSDEVAAGGGVSVDSESFDTSVRDELVQHSLIFLIMWLVGIGGIFFSSLRLSEYALRQKKIEDSLRESELRHRELTDNLPQSVFHKDVNGVYVSCNKHYADDLGILPEDIIGKTDFDFHPDELAEKYLADDRRLMESGATEEIEESYIKDGQEILIQTVKTPLRDDAGNVTGILGIFRDITELKRSEEALVESTARFKELMHQSPVVFELYDLDGVQTDVNAAYEKLWGFPASHTVNKFNVLKSKQVEDTGLMVYVKKAYAGEAVTVPEYEFDSSGKTEADGIGRKRWLSTRIFPLKNKSGQVENIVITHEDVTDRKEVERNRNIVSERLRLSVENMQEGYAMHEAIFDKDGKMVDFKYLEFNPAAGKIVNIPREEIIGKTGLEIFPSLAERGLLDKYAEVMATGESAYIQDFYYDGDNLNMAFDISCFRLDKKYFVCIFSDITERVKYEENILAKAEQLRAANQQLLASEQQLRATNQQLAASEQQLIASNQQLLGNQQERAELIKTLEFKNKELQDIVYTASHDLKSPLVNLSGFSGHLSMSCENLQEFMKSIDDESTQLKIKETIEHEIPESLGFITSSVVKMKSLIDGLLRISRIGTVEMDITEVDMNGLLLQVRDAMGYQLKENVSRFHIGALPVCRGDIGLLSQVFTNLIDNSIKYREPSRDCEIEITGEIVGREVVYCVKDNGIGVEEAYRGKVFEIFHRLDPDSGILGDGLGLTIVTRIVDRLGGRIWLESESGTGCEFFVALPHRR